MKNIYLFTIAYFVINSYCYSQINYEMGYFIDNANQKIICLIKDQDWKNNPTEFLYRLSEESGILKANIQTVSEFGINNGVKYQRFEVDIDRSSNLTESISTQKQPIFKNEELFLEVLVSGKATLYSYKSVNLKRYFFNVNNEIKQLVSKKYSESKNRIGENNHYKQQLSNNLECNELTIDRFRSIKYEQRALIDLFVDYNDCSNFEYVVFSTQQKDKFNLNLRLGINSSSFSMENIYSPMSDPIDFGNDISFRIGLEVEYVLPFNKNKWAIIVEPAYNYHKSEASDDYGDTTADIKSIDIPIGLRHYLFLDSKSKLFVNASFLTGLGFNSTIEGYFIDASGIRNNMVFGIGYKYKKMSLELKYDTQSDVFNNSTWISDYQRASLVFGYSIF